MTPSQLAETLSADAPPTGLAQPAQALWWDRKGDWDRAHECAQASSGKLGDAIHAYLHRKEGDLANAGYWYARAGRPAAGCPLETEWDALAAEALGAGPAG